MSDSQQPLPTTVVETRQPSPHQSRSEGTRIGAVVSVAYYAFLLTVLALFIIDFQWPDLGLGRLMTVVQIIFGVLSLGGVVHLILRWLRMSGAIAVAAVVSATVLTPLVVLIAKAPTGDEAAPRPSWSVDIGPTATPISTPGPSRNELSLIGSKDAHQGDMRLRALATSVDFSVDGTLVATGGQDQLIRIWSADDGELVGELRGHAHHISTLAFNPQTGVLASGGWDSTVRFWNVADGTPGGIIEVGDDVHGLDFTDDGASLVVGAGWRVVVYDTATLAVRWSATMPNVGIDRVAISPDGTRVAAMTGNTLAEPDEYLGFLWELPSGRLVAELAGHDNHIRGVAFSPDNAQLVTTGFDGRVQRFEAETGALIESRTDNAGGVNWVTFHPDRSFYALADGWDLVIRDANSGASVVRQSAFTTEAMGVAFSPDGSTMAAVSYDGKLSLWSVSLV